MEIYSKMTEVSANSTNINSHYSSATRTTRPKGLVVAGPNAIPGQHLYNDIDAKNRIRQLNKEIEVQSKDFRKNPAKQFWKIFGCIVAGILGIIGIKKLISFFK